MCIVCVRGAFLYYYVPPLNVTSVAGQSTGKIVLKCMFVDTVYMNVMRINSEYEGPNYLVCDSIEEYLRFEQHRSCLVSRVICGGYEYREPGNTMRGGQYV
jgi:hypothetical protein